MNDSDQNKMQKKKVGINVVFKGPEAIIFVYDEAHNNLY